MLLAFIASATMSCELGCGGAGKASPSRTVPARVVTGSEPASSASGSTVIGGDRDQDDTHGVYDNDNGRVVDYGRAATAAERATIVQLVKSYYAAGAAGSGTKACALMYSTLARAIPESYGRPPGPPALRGGTCAAVMTKMFRQVHSRMANAVAVLSVRRVRVEGRRGFVMLRVDDSMEERTLAVRREDRRWKVDAPVDVGLV